MEARGCWGCEKKVGVDACNAKWIEVETNGKFKVKWSDESLFTLKKVMLLPSAK